MRMIPSSVPKVKMVEVAKPELGSSWWIADMGVGNREGRLRFQGFLYRLVVFQSPLVDPECGDPQS